MINQRTYEILASSLISAGENVVNSILRNLLRANKLLTKDPYDISRAKKIYDKNLELVMKQYKKNYKTWTEKELAKAYLEGLRRAEKELKSYGLNTRITDNASNVSTVLLNRSNAIIPSIPEIPGQTILMFEGLERHIEYFGVFRSAAYYSLEGTELQILRKANDLFRDVAVMAGEQHFKESDIFTRRRLSQTMLNNFAKRGVNCITYADGRNFSIDSYCEMIGRTMSGRCALQSSINRYYESGYKLVMVSSHFRACPLCTPYENEILSVDGKHQFYQSLADAELQGLFHSNCYSDDTEVYTTNGWKLFKDVCKKDMIFSLNPESHMPEWVNFNKKIQYELKDEMILFKSNSFDLLVTKKHNMYIGVNSHKENRIKTVKWKFEHAEKCLNKNFKQLRSVRWEGENVNYDTFGYTKKQFAFLLGIYLAEGYIDKNCNGNYNRIAISQQKKEGIEKVSEILTPMGFYYSGNKFIKDNKRLAEYFKMFGKSYQKYVPDYILNEKPDIISEFLRGFIVGDGSIRKNKSKLKNIESIEKTYFTSSKRLSEHIGECILKTDRYPSFFISSKKGTIVKHKNGEYIQNHDIIGIRENNSKMSYHNISKSIKHRGIQSSVVKNYEGIVYCLELEKNHIMLVRRNGKISWCGNCAHNVTSYHEGLTERNLPSVDPFEQKLIDEYGYNDAQKITYLAQQQQRYIERKIREYKRVDSIAISKRDSEKARSKIRYWQSRQREHLQEHQYLPRKYIREQIKFAH